MSDNDRPSVNLQQTLEFGLIHHQAGRLSVAEQLYRQVLAVDPQEPDALRLLGVLAHQGGNYDLAVDFFRKSLLGNPTSTDTLNNLAIALGELGHTDEALEAFQDALNLSPNNIGILNRFGNMLKKAGDRAKAVECYRKAISIDPMHEEFFNNLGLALHEMGDLNEAVELFQKALELSDDTPDIHFNLANALRELSRLGEAFQEYQRAIALKPDHVEALSNMGLTQQEAGNIDDALETFKRAIAINPEFLEALNGLGNAYHELGMMDEAVAVYQDALAKNPLSAELLSNSALALQTKGENDDAALNYKKSLSVNPLLEEVHSNLIFTQELVGSVSQQELQDERKRWNETFIRPLEKYIRPHENDRNPSRRLRIGYVSADFRQHSACNGFAPLFFQFDKENFDVIGYDATIVTDDKTEALKEAATDWRRIHHVGDQNLADMVRADGIDILVDLAGHTRGNRLTLFGYKPAPLQVTGIGHQAPGLSTIDYRLTTREITPENEASIYPEAPIYLKTYFGYTPPDPSPPLAPPPFLENGKITFGFLGRFSKISEETLDVWGRILRDIPASKMLFKFTQAQEPAIREKIASALSRFGVNDKRLIWLGRSNQFQHLQAHNQVDIALDTFPHAGGITSLESLWMGVPVIGLNYNRASGRTLRSICRPFGLEELVGNSPEEYHAIAVEWAEKKENLQTLRKQLRDQVRDIYERFPGEVETSYRRIWQRWCRDEPASPLDLFAEG